jgi:hypothetical protein
VTALTVTVPNVSGTGIEIFTLRQLLADTYYKTVGSTNCYDKADCAGGCGTKRYFTSRQVTRNHVRGFGWYCRKQDCLWYARARAPYLAKRAAITADTMTDLANAYIQRVDGTRYNG